MKDIYVVCVPRVKGVSRERMRQYIREAVRMWGGQFEPVDGPNGGDPLGPPCPLMERGAVTVYTEPRDPLKRYGGMMSYSRRPR